MPAARTHDTVSRRFFRPARAAPCLAPAPARPAAARARNFRLRVSLSEAPEPERLAAPAAPVELQATLKETLETMHATGAEAFYVAQQTVPAIERIFGVLTGANIERYYRQS